MMSMNINKRCNYYYSVQYSYSSMLLLILIVWWICVCWSLEHEVHISIALPVLLQYSATTCCYSSPPVSLQQPTSIMLMLNLLVVLASPTLLAIIMSHMTISYPNQSLCSGNECHLVCSLQSCHHPWLLYEYYEVIVSISIWYQIIIPTTTTIYCIDKNWHVYKHVYSSILLSSSFILHS